MNPTKTIQYIQTADGVKLRCGIWNNPNPGDKATVLLLHGRTEFIEKYGEFVDELIAKGFRVVSFDWRGQGLSDRHPKANSKGHVDQFDQYLCDLDTLLEQPGLVDPSLPQYLIAHSMGGHLALRYLHKHPTQFDKALLLSPMVDIRFSPFPKSFAHWMTQRAIHRGRNYEFVMGAGKISRIHLPFFNNLLTSDKTRFDTETELLRKQPDLMTGDPTYGWLSASCASIKQMNKPNFAADISTPIRVLIAECDRVVDNQAIIKLCKRLPNCSYQTIAGARHELLMETDAIREQVWRNIDEFFDG